MGEYTKEIDNQAFDEMFTRLQGCLGNEAELAAQIKSLRVQQGLTQKELAERMGIPQSQLSRWENTGVCERDSLERLCRELAVKQPVKVQVFMWKKLTGQAPVYDSPEQSVIAEFMLYSGAEEYRNGSGKTLENLVDEIGNFIKRCFPFPYGKSHTKSGVCYEIHVDGTEQVGTGLLDRPEASIRWLLYELQHVLCLREGERLRIRRYMQGNDFVTCIKEGYLSSMNLVRKDRRDTYEIMEWSQAGQEPYYPYETGQTCIFMPVTWDNCVDQKFRDMANMMIYTLRGTDQFNPGIGFGGGGLREVSRRTLELDTRDTDGKELGFYNNLRGEPVGMKLHGKIVSRIVKPKKEEGEEEEQELWSELREGYFMAVYEPRSAVNEYVLLDGEHRCYQNGRLLHRRIINQTPFAGADGSIYQSDSWGFGYEDYRLQGTQELWLAESDAEAGGKEGEQSEFRNYKEYYYPLSDWKIGTECPDIEYSGVDLKSWRGSTFDYRCGMETNKGLKLLRDVKDGRRYGRYVIYFKVGKGRYCCLRYDGNARRENEIYPGSKSCVALTFCQGADDQIGFPAPSTLRPLAENDPDNYTYLFRLEKISNHRYTGMPFLIGERSFQDFCLEIQRDSSFTNIRRLLPDTKGPDNPVLIYRGADGKAYLGGISQGEFKDCRTHGFQDLQSSALWLKGFGDPESADDIRRARALFAYPSMTGVAVSAWENEKNYLRKPGAQDQAGGEEVTGGAYQAGGEDVPGSLHPQPGATPENGAAPTPPAGFISREEVAALLFPPEQGMIEIAQVVDEIHRLVVEWGYSGEAGQPVAAKGFRRPPNFVILGKPGVGKTALARNLVNALVKFHVIPQSDTDPDNMLLAVNGRDLVGKFIGHTRPKTIRVINQAMERKAVLFLDEVYTLFNPSAQDFGHEALETLLPVLKGDCRLPKIVYDEKSGQETETYETCREDQLPLILMAGYEKETRKFLNDNPGLYSRITILELPAPSVPELVRDLELRLNRQVPELLGSRTFEGGELRQVEQFYGRVIGQEYADQFGYFRGNETLAKRLATEFCFLRSQGLPGGWEAVWRTVTERYNKELIRNYESILEANEERMGRTRRQFRLEQDITETFKDVKGQETAVEKLEEVVDMLTRGDAYRLSGARLPKGALLVGPPGTGKTLLARAVAGEVSMRLGAADPGCKRGRVAFIALAATDLLAGGLSTGADRVRDLFLQAQKSEAAAVIMFIDELDAVARRRGTGGNTDEVLIALLNGMDGFTGGKDIFVLGATNRPETLDPAILRPGRFDRRIPVGMPDRAGREDILRLYAQKQLRPALARGLKVKEEALDARWAEYGEAVIRELAAKSYGASPAQLANIVNEAGILAARREAGSENTPSPGCLYTVTREDLLEALETLIVGLPSRRVPTPEEKRIVAIHEIGHAIFNVVDREGRPLAPEQASRPFEKVTCVPRGEDALGYVINLPREERYLQNREDMLWEVCGLLGGRAAEELSAGAGSVTQGASDDIRRATGIVRRMVAEYGMYDLFGPAAVESLGGDYLGNGTGGTILSGLEAEISHEVIRVVKEQYDRTKRVLEQYSGPLSTLALALVERETLSGEEFMEIWSELI